MSQALTFRILSGEDDDFVRDFEVMASQTLMDLHHAIQENLHFDPGLMSSFFTTDESWNKEEEFPLINMTGEPGNRTMENTRVGDLVSGEGDRLLYVYDYLSIRGFFMEVVEVAGAEEGKSYPVCLRAAGKPPRQLQTEDLSDLPGEDLLSDDEEDLLSDGYESLDDLQI